MVKPAFVVVCYSCGTKNGLPEGTQQFQCWSCGTLARCEPKRRKERESVSRNHILNANADNKIQNLMNVHTQTQQNVQNSNQNRIHSKLLQNPANKSVNINPTIQLKGSHSTDEEELIRREDEELARALAESEMSLQQELYSELSQKSLSNLSKSEGHSNNNNANSNGKKPNSVDLTMDDNTGPTDNPLRSSDNLDDEEMLRSISGTKQTAKVRAPKSGKIRTFLDDEAEKSAEAENSQIRSDLATCTIDLDTAPTVSLDYQADVTEGDKLPKASDINTATVDPALNSLLDAQAREYERRIQYAENEFQNNRRSLLLVEKERDEAYRDIQAGKQEISRVKEEIKERDAVIVKLKASYEEESTLLIQQFQERIDELESQLKGGKVEWTKNNRNNLTD